MGISVISALTGRAVAAAKKSPCLAIFTDASNIGDVPQEVRRAADMIATEDLSVLEGKPIEQGLDGAIAWVAGDRMMCGGSADIRREFFTASPMCTLVPVHLPCLAEAEFISIHPRLIAVGARDERLSHAVRIAGATTLSPRARATFEASEEPWAQLHLALLREGEPGAGLDELGRLWSSAHLQRAIKALVLRNIILALMRQRAFEKAERLLQAGFDVYPDYAELHYLDAIRLIAMEKSTQALGSLNRAISSSGRDFVGSGGESGYRAAWLLGTIMESAGNQFQALGHFLPGVHQRPAFELSVLGILRQRLSRGRASQLQLLLCELVRREPRYLERVFDFYLRHRELDAPRRLLRTLPLSDEVRHVLQSRLNEVEAVNRPARPGAKRRPGVVLQGPFLMHSGHARINRELARALLNTDSVDAALEQFDLANAPDGNFKEGQEIREGLRRHPERVDLTIRHHWPPDFRRPAAGKLACIVPWEHRAVPLAWVREIQANVDELWVPSKFVANGFAEGGVDPQRIQVIPNGVDREVFHPDVEPWRPTECRDCAFLFVGGTIRRKGIDLLIRAYLEAFTRTDDVTLIVKDLGATTFYGHNNMLGQILQLSRKHELAHIIALRNEMDDADLARLYRGCDALVLPYRGEGFGMPLAEAMACGTPVVTTAAGPAMEFCSTETAYLISAEEVPVPDEPPQVGKFSRDWTWFDPSVEQLAETLRTIYENRAEARRRGKNAAAVGKLFAWPRITRMYLDRVAALTQTETPAAAPAPRQYAGVAK